MKVINSIDRGLAKIEEFICLILLTAMICVVTLQVLNQAFLHIRTIVWTEEVSRILFVWSIMIGSSLAVRKGDHLTVDFIYTRFKGNARYILQRSRPQEILVTLEPKGPPVFGWLRCFLGVLQ